MARDDQQWRHRVSIIKTLPGWSWWRLEKSAWWPTVVAEAHRRRGLGTRLIRVVEDAARTAGRTRVGIGVGSYGDYGEAQRLYVRLGDVPNRRGITYRNYPRWRTRERTWRLGALVCQANTPDTVKR